MIAAGGSVGVANWYYSPLRDVITVHAGEARSRAWYWGRGPDVVAAIWTGFHVKGGQESVQADNHGWPGDIRKLRCVP
jgi:D-aminopeptidase